MQEKWQQLESFAMDGDSLKTITRSSRKMVYRPRWNTKTTQLLLLHTYAMCITASTVYESRHFPYSSTNTTPAVVLLLEQWVCTNIHFDYI